jgi:hypothetical protein
MNVQVVRSVSDWSHGVLTEHSIQNACAWLSFPSFFPDTCWMGALVLAPRLWLTWVRRAGAGVLASSLRAPVVLAPPIMCNEHGGKIA